MKLGPATGESFSEAAAGRSLHRRSSALCIVVACLSAAGTVVAADFNVSNSGSSAYIINAQSNPTLTLTRGQTYSFAVSAAGHPFYIKTARGTGTGSAYNTGVVNNGTTSATLTFTVPVNAPATLFYQCSLHGAMGGTINIVDPPPPPTVRVVSWSVTTNIVLRSTGTNTWSLVPEYASNLIGAVWAPVTVFSNNYASGTNTTSFGRLDAICGSNVFLRIRQTKP